MFLSFTTIHTKRSLLFALVIVALAFPAIGLAAQVQVLPESGSYALGQTFIVKVAVVPEGDSVNAVEASLEFDPAILSVSAISKDNSDLSRWSIAPTYSNSLGTINFAGVSEAPLTSSSNLLEITFVTLASGDGGLSIADAAVFATDGLRTDVYSDGESATFTVTSASIEDEVEEEDLAKATDIPVATSEVFVDPEIWYGVATGTFTWELPAGTEAVAVEITDIADNRPNNNPNAIYESPIEEFVITPDVVSDGVHYFSLRFRDEDGWGEALNQKLLIDSTPPEPFKVEVESAGAGSFPTLRFEAVDFTSGLVGYEIAIATCEPVMLTYDEAKLGYQLSRLEDGMHDVTITAFDRAGNSRVSKVSVEVNAGWIPAMGKEMSKTTSPFMDIPNLSIFILAVIVVLLLIHVYFERKQLRIKEAKLKNETSQIQEQMEKIFTALRDEIYDQINTITKKKRLSKAEKEAVAGLNQAIEVSETLIEKEINDVKSILK